MLRPTMGVLSPMSLVLLQATPCLVGAMTSRLAGHGGDSADASPDGSGGWTAARRADGIISPMARLRQAQHRCASQPCTCMHDTAQLHERMHAATSGMARSDMAAGKTEPTLPGFPNQRLFGVV